LPLRAPLIQLQTISPGSSSLTLPSQSPCNTKKLKPQTKPLFIFAAANQNLPSMRHQLTSCSCTSPKSNICITKKKQKAQPKLNHPDHAKQIKPSKPYSSQPAHTMTLQIHYIHQKVNKSTHCTPSPPSTIA
jgi:hypothetical protein